MEPPPALAILGQRFGLTPFELDVLLLCVAFELDTRIAGLCARAHDDPQRAYPTFALAITLFDDASWDVTSLERPLRRWQFINVDRRAALPLTLSPLHSDARTVDFVKGFNRIDERLANLIIPHASAAEDALSESQRVLVDRIAGVFSSPSEASTIQLAGPDIGAKFQIAGALAERIKRQVWQLKSAWLPVVPADIDDLARLWRRETVLAPTMLVFDAQEIGEDRETETVKTARRFLSRQVGDVLLAVANLAVAAPAIVLWLARGAGYRLHFEPLEEALPEDRKRAARIVNERVERLVRACPAQYLWGYNRYKRPAGGPPAPAGTNTSP